MDNISKRITGAVCSAGIVGLLSATFLDEPHVHVDTPGEIADQLAAAPVDANKLAAHLASADAHYRANAPPHAQDLLVADGTLVKCDDALRSASETDDDLACPPALAEVGKGDRSAGRA
jgi:hypothetical protein